MKRSIERWTSMVPEAVAQGSTTQASYCIADAQHDIIELFRENKEAADQMRRDTATIAALQVENERLTRELGDAHVHSEAQQRRYLQAEATAAAVVGALEKIATSGLFTGTAYDDLTECAKRTLATLPARALAMAEVVKAAERLIADKSEVLKYASHYYKVSVEVMIDLVASLATYHAEPVSQSETDKG
jgi:hypothetical protein